MEYLRTHSKEEAAAHFDVSEESLRLIGISATLIRRVVKLMDAKLIWAPGVTLCDGIAYEYAEKIKSSCRSMILNRTSWACARNISKRFLGANAGARRWSISA